MTNSVASKTFGVAIMALLTMLGFFASTQIPFLAALMISLAGIPAFVVVLAWGGLWFLGYSLLTLILAVSLSSPGTALVLASLILVPAAMLAVAVRSGLAPLHAITLTVLSATLFSTAAWGLAYGFDSDGEVMAPVREGLTRQMQVVESQLTKIEAESSESTETTEAVRQNLKLVYDHILLLFPATALFVWYMITLPLCYCAARRFATQSCLSALPAFSQCRLDWNLIWLFIGGWVLFHLSGSSESQLGSIAAAIGANCLAISNIIYFVAGLSLLFFMFDKYRVGAIARVGVSCLALLFTHAVVWLGIIDVWADFRTPRAALFSSGGSDDEA